MKFCRDTYFYEILCLKINWNVDMAHLSNKICLSHEIYWSQQYVIFRVNGIQSVDRLL